MLRSTNNIFQSLKDQVRGVRYSIRAEAAAPGSVLPKALRDSDLGPLLAIGSALGVPALRLADGLFTQVESMASAVLVPSRGGEAQFPCSLDAYRTGSASFSARLYGPVKDMLRQHGTQNMLVSEQALDSVWAQVGSRHGDIPSTSSVSIRSDEGRDRIVQVCAGIACAFVTARPIRKVAFADGTAVKPHFMLSPNLYCGLTVGLAIAVASLNPTSGQDSDAVLESVDSVVDARFGRFQQAMTSKTPIPSLAKEFKAILPFLP